MSKTTAAISYIVGTLLMAFGWLCALVQGDAPRQQPRIAGIVTIFVVALVLLTLPAVRLLRARRMTQVLTLLGIGFQALVCLYVIAMEFTQDLALN